MFRPQLYPNEMIPPEGMKYPLIASYKLDGIRCLVKDGKVLSRSLKPLPNHHLPLLLQEYVRHSLGGVVFDGELYAHNTPFNELTSIIMSKDKPLPPALTYYVFDLPSLTSKPYKYRLNIIRINKFPTPKSRLCDNYYDVECFLQDAYNEGYEGLILTNPNSYYKHGRITLSSGNGYKLKRYLTFDGVIKGVVRGTRARRGSLRTTNELGYSVTSRKKADRVPDDKASAFVVDYNGHDLKVALALSDVERSYVWYERDKYIGRCIEYKGLLTGSKNVPRHPVFVRFRDDKRL